MGRFYGEREQLRGKANNSSCAFGNFNEMYKHSRCVN